jgi:RNA polymerase sigma-70 factor, ECF subfamily
MSDLEQFNLMRSFLAAPHGCASPEEKMAWEDFIHAHGHLIWKICRRSDECLEEVNDLVQDTWLILFRRLPKLHLDCAPGALAAWVAGIAHRVAGKHAGRRSISKRRRIPLTAEVAAELLDPDAGPAAKCSLMLRREQVRAILEKLGASLPERHRRIMQMHWVEDRSVAEIAAEVGLSEDCVGSILRRIRLRLPELLRRAELDAW